MTNYRVTLKLTAQKELKAFPAQVIKRIVERLEALTANPRPPGCKKLKGGDNEWRIRVADYRVIYTIDDSERLVEITRMRHRSEVYE